MSQMVSQTLQAAVLSMMSNLLAQVISSYKENVCGTSSLSCPPAIHADRSSQAPFTLNLAPILKFGLYALINNPANIVWQNLLEESYPTHVPASPVEKAKADGKPPAKKTSGKNVLTKFLLDQTFGATMNTVMFLAYMGYVNASSQGKYSAWDAVGAEVKSKFWPIVIDGMKIWPLFSLVSFLWIPVQHRVLVGCAVGMLWGVYLSLMVG
jgi:hypothetical protein